MEVRERWSVMLEQPLPDCKMDHWGTIFQAIVPDDNQGRLAIFVSNFLSFDDSHFSFFFQL